MKKQMFLIVMAGFLSILGFMGCAHKCPCSQPSAAQPAYAQPAAAPAPTSAPAGSQYIK